MIRKSGILIHPTSFPGHDACGTIGPDAFAIIDLLHSLKQSYLQILSIGPTDYSNSPYNSLSSFAGNPYLLSLDTLRDKKLLTQKDIDDYGKYESGRSDFGVLYYRKNVLLKKAYTAFKAKGHSDDFELFCANNHYWLHDHSLFMAFKDMNDGKSWTQWPEEYRLRRNLAGISVGLKDAAAFHSFLQYEFFAQWKDLRAYAQSKGIQIIGDIPIYVSFDSADVWAHPELFMLDGNGIPTEVSGVPHDGLSDKGQLWGGPLYRWDVHASDRYSWWKKRLALLLQLVDCIKIDHFRGFESFWAVPYGETDPDKGRWVKGPSHDFFGELRNVYGDRTNQIFFPEDLGCITNEVHHLRDSFGLPGMRIIQFVPFDKDHEYPHSKDLPSNFIENCLAYTGTHDNDLIYGWFDKSTDHAKHNILQYFGASYENLGMKVVERLFHSGAARTIVPMQEIFSLGTEHRINTPGTSGDHNWTWRMTAEMLENNKDNLNRFREITEQSGRANG